MNVFLFLTRKINSFPNAPCTILSITFPVASAMACLINFTMQFRKVFAYTVKLFFKEGHQIPDPGSRIKVRSIFAYTFLKHKPVGGLMDKHFFSRRLTLINR